MSKKTTTLVATVALAIFALTGMAWACTPSTYLELEPNYGPSGTKVLVDGRFPTDAEVRIRWDSSAGTVLATTRGPDFSVEVTIPPVPYDTYTIVAESNNLVKSWKASAPFTVTDRVAPKRTVAQPQGGSTGEDNTATEQNDSRSPQGSESTTDAPVDRSDRGSGDPQTVPAAGPAGRAAPALSGSTTGASTSNSSTTPATAPNPTADVAAPGAAAEAQLPQYLRSVNSDLWSGFDPSRPSLGPSELSAPQGSPGAPIVAGMVLVGFGAVVGTAGMGIAIAHRRRRSPA